MSQEQKKKPLSPEAKALLEKVSNQTHAQKLLETPGLDPEIAKKAKAVVEAVCRGCKYLYNGALFRNQPACRYPRKRKTLIIPKEVRNEAGLIQLPYCTGFKGF